MKAFTYTDARKNLKALIQTVCQDSEPSVLISLEDHQAMEETAYLLSSPADGAHLEKSLEQAASGRLITLPVEDL
jgi:antitoxin YefM